jgi:hypothetical protein
MEYIRDVHKMLIRTREGSGLLEKSLTLLPRRLWFEGVQTDMRIMYWHWWLPFWTFHAISTVQTSCKWYVLFGSFRIRSQTKMYTVLVTEKYLTNNILKLRPLIVVYFLRVKNFYGLLWRNPFYTILQQISYHRFRLFFLYLHPYYRFIMRYFGEDKRIWE